MIDKLSIEMKMASLSNKKEGMSLAEKYYDKYMAETLDKVISSYSEEHNLFIESLNIDLGKIRPDIIPLALEKALREQLDNLISKQNIEQNRKIEIQQNIEEITDFRNYSQLLFYLENGYYEYLQEKKNADSNRPSQIEMLNICLANKSGKQTLLSVIVKDKQALFRLTNIASKETLLKILDILIEEQISPISERTTIQRFKTFAKKQTNKKGVAYLIEELLFHSKSKTEEDISKEINSIESREEESEFQEKKQTKNRTSEILQEKVSEEEVTFEENNSKEKNKRSKEGNDSENPQEKKDEKHSGSEENRRKEEDSTTAINPPSKSSHTKDRVAELYDKATEESFNISNQESFNKNKRIHLYDAGLVLLSPFFTTLFKRLDYLDEKNDFKSLKE
ncbi:MAG TPA: contractile injection system tape measure protein, partial [Paludibacteraceae bacterium]|nr:contractile injection system tape measure protein [Paludibacteraceae bacterium]